MISTYYPDPTTLKVILTLGSSCIFWFTLGTVSFFLFKMCVRFGRHVKSIFENENRILRESNDLNIARQQEVINDERIRRDMSRREQLASVGVDMAGGQIMGVNGDGYVEFRQQYTDTWNGFYINSMPISTQFSESQELAIRNIIMSEIQKLKKETGYCCICDR